MYGGRWTIWSPDRTSIAGAWRSWAQLGGELAPVFVAVEPRFKAAVLVSPAFYVQRAEPEVEAIHFAPRVGIPVLMLNGRFDFSCRKRTRRSRCSVPRNTEKSRVVYDTGHNIPRPDLIRESLNWLEYVPGAGEVGARGGQERIRARPSAFAR